MNEVFSLSVPGEIANENRQKKGQNRTNSPSHTAVPWVPLIQQAPQAVAVTERMSAELKQDVRRPQVLRDGARPSLDQGPASPIR